MKWFFYTWGAAVAVLFLGFLGWIVTRSMHADTANYVVGRVIVIDLYALAIIMAYVAFVGGWHLWERLTGRMDLDIEDRRERARARRVEGASGVEGPSASPATDDEQAAERLIARPSDR